MNAIVQAAVVILVILSVIGSLAFTLRNYNASISKTGSFPPYGSIYIKSIDFSTGEVTIVNNYGKLVRIPIVVHYNIGNNTWVYKTVYVEAYPGTYTVNLLNLLGAGSNVTVDYEGSFMLIGASRYPLLPGSGYAKPILVGERNITGVKIRFPFLGQSVDKNTSIYEAGTYDSDKAYLAPSLTVKTQYHRDVGSIHQYRYLAEKEYGSRCIYNSTQETGYEYSNTTRDCEIAQCSLEQDTVNTSYTNSTYKTKICGYSGDYLYGESAVSAPYTDYALPVYIPGASGKPVPLSRQTGYVGPSDNETGYYPYKVNKTACEYEYKEYEWTANLTHRDQFICDDICGSVLQGTFCNETKKLVKEETRYGCDGVCIKFADMLRVEIISFSMNTSTTSVLVDDSLIIVKGDIYSKGKIWVNSTDPDIIPRNMTVEFTLRVKLTMPAGHAYLTLPQGGYLTDVKLVYITNMTAYGWLNTTDRDYKLYINIPVNKTVLPVEEYDGQNTYKILVPLSQLLYEYHKTISVKPHTVDYVLLLHYNIEVHIVLNIAEGVR